MREYEVASGGKINVEIVDPRRTRSWRPRPTRSTASSRRRSSVAGRYEESVISSYFDILMRYGDQNIVLGFNDLIELSPSGPASTMSACATPNTT